MTVFVTWPGHCTAAQYRDACQNCIYIRTTTTTTQLPKEAKYTKLCCYYRSHNMQYHTQLLSSGNLKRKIRTNSTKIFLSLTPGVQIRWSNLPPICVEASQTQYTIQQQKSDAQKTSMLSRQHLRKWNTGK